MPKVNVGKNTLARIENPDYGEWTMEELVRGQRRSRTGRWQGRRPKVIPMALLEEINRRIAPEVHRNLLQGAIAGSEYLRKVAEGSIEPDANRTHVVEVCLNRTMGTTPHLVQVLTEGDGDSNPYRQGAGEVTRAVVLREVIDVESEEYVNPFEEDVKRPTPLDTETG
jgi:hypothetical protein